MKGKSGIPASAAPACDAVADVLQYAMYLRHGGHRTDCVHVDRTAALKWLIHRRPKVLERVRALDRVA
jgi:hypothetical protein